jgi:glycosyltransferase involved in cell wall biosynthesis
VACVSASTRSQLSRWFGVEVWKKAEVIFNAVESKPSAIQGPLPELSDEASFVLSVSQHRQNKNIPLAIRIFADAVGRGILPRKTLLLIIGITGPATHQVRREIGKSGLDSQIRLLSGVSEDDLQWCYRRCKCLLAPSSIEGFGLPIAEALLAGCPVVCSDIPAFREIGRDAVRYVPFGERILEEYSRAIRELLAEDRPNPLRLAHLSPQAIGSQYLNLYRKVINMGCAPEAKKQLNVRSILD